MSPRCFLKYPLYVEWTMKLPTVDKTIKSPKFSIRDLECNLELTYGCWEVYELTVFIKNATEEFLKNYSSVTSFLEHPYTKSPIVFNRTSLESNNVLWTVPRVDILKDIPNLIDSNKFTIICLFHNTEPYVEKTDALTQTTLTSIPIDLKSLSRNFPTFLGDESFSDVKLKCAGCNFSAHRLVLAARSEVFAAMFRNKMSEAEAGVVDIQDLELDVLVLLLQYMYLGEITDLCEDTARCLYEAADKYAVYDLRQACSDWMVEYQTPENCLDLLVFADRHSDKIFKEAVICFVAEHLADLDSESWFTLRKMYPLLVLSILEKCMEDSLPGAARKEKFSDT